MVKKIVRHIGSNVRKQVEYQTFLTLIGKGQIPANWQDMAEALGVKPGTISEWKKLPEFQEALLQGIDESFKRMSQTGQKQWQMWRERYAMLTKEAEKKANVAVQVNNIIGVKRDEYGF